MRAPSALPFSMAFFTSFLYFFSCFSQGCGGGQPAQAWKWLVSHGVVTGGDYGADGTYEPSGSANDFTREDGLFRVHWSGCDWRLQRKEDPDEPDGMLFKNLKTECRYKMIASNEDAVKQYLKDLEPACVSGDSSYEERKGARDDEIAGLKQAQGILKAAFGKQPGTFLQKRA